MDDRAHRIYDFLRKHPDTWFERSTILKATGYTESSITDKALKRVAEFAEADGYCIPWREHSHGYRYCLTLDDPNKVTDAYLWGASVEAGVHRGVRRQGEFIDAHRAKLSPKDAALMKAQIDTANALELAQASLAALTKAVMAARK